MSGAIATARGDVRRMGRALARYAAALAVTSESASFPRPPGTRENPLLVRTYVQRLPGSAESGAALETRPAERVAGELHRRISGVVPLVDVTVVETSPRSGRTAISHRGTETRREHDPGVR